MPHARYTPCSHTMYASADCVRPGARWSGTTTILPRTRLIQFDVAGQPVRLAGYCVAYGQAADDATRYDVTYHFRPIDDTPVTIHRVDYEIKFDVKPSSNELPAPDVVMRHDPTGTLVTIDYEYAAYGTHTTHYVCKPLDGSEPFSIQDRANLSHTETRYLYRLKNHSERFDITESMTSAAQDTLADAAWPAIVGWLRDNAAQLRQWAVDLYHVNQSLRWHAEAERTRKEYIRQLNTMRKHQGLPALDMNGAVVHVDELPDPEPASVEEQLTGEQAIMHLAEYVTDVIDLAPVTLPGVITIFEDNAKSDWPDFHEALLATARHETSWPDARESLQTVRDELYTRILEPLDNHLARGDNAADDARNRIKTLAEDYYKATGDGQPHAEISAYRKSKVEYNNKKAQSFCEERGLAEYLRTKISLDARKFKKAFTDGDIDDVPDDVASHGESIIVSIGQLGQLVIQDEMLEKQTGADTEAGTA